MVDAPGFEPGASGARTRRLANSTTRQQAMVGMAGLEPATSALSGPRSYQLSYTPTDG
jgi:hypothetical protein